MSPQKRRRLLTAMLGASFIGSAAAALAEDALEEVTVTAQKRTERLSDVPLSITAVTGEQLANQGINDATDLERVVPGFDYQKSTYGAPVFAIRGIGVYDTFIGMSPTVTVYVDQVPLPYLAMAQAAAMDLERLEVLKGPQGTLFGQNSTGGAINYIAAKPTKTLQLGADATYGRFDEFDANAFLSGPITDTLSARLSVRRESRGDWQVSESRPNDPAAPGSCVTVDTAFNTVPIVRDSLDQNNVSWRAGLNWKPAEETLIYANATKGFKAGSFTPLPAVFASQLTPVTQESVLAYELGFRMSPLQRKLEISGAGFYYDYRNKQILGYKSFTAFGNLPALQNIPKSSIRGAELQATVLPLQGLRITGGASYIDSRVDDSIIAPDPFGNSIDLKGEAFPNAPKWQFISDADYEFSVSNALSLFVGGDVKYRTSTNAAFGNTVATEIPAYALVDLRAGVQSNDGVWRVQLWGRNVFNRYYLLNVSHVTDTVARTTGMPATYGITVSARFN